MKEILWSRFFVLNISEVINEFELQIITLFPIHQTLFPQYKSFLRVFFCNLNYQFCFTTMWIWLGGLQLCFLKILLHICSGSRFSGWCTFGACGSWFWIVSWMRFVINLPLFHVWWMKICMELECREIHVRMREKHAFKSKWALQFLMFCSAYINCFWTPHINISTPSLFLSAPCSLHGCFFLHLHTFFSHLHRFSYFQKCPFVIFRIT